jgi:hypothetical protein
MKESFEIKKNLFIYKYIKKLKSKLIKHIGVILSYFKILIFLNF